MHLNFFTIYMFLSPLKLFLLEVGSFFINAMLCSYETIFVAPIYFCSNCVCVWRKKLYNYFLLSSSPSRQWFCTNWPYVFTHVFLYCYSRCVWPVSGFFPWAHYLLFAVRVAHGMSYSLFRVLNIHSIH